MRVVRLDHVVLRVRDLDAALGFYGGVLGLPVESLDEYRAGRRPFVSVRVGEQLIDLVPDPTWEPATARERSGLLHLCLEVDGRLADLVPALRARGVTVLEAEPVRRLGARGWGLSVYVSDPDGHVVELKEPVA